MAVAILLIFLEEEIKFQHWKRDDKKEDKVRSKAIKKRQGASSICHLH